MKKHLVLMLALAFLVIPAHASAHGDEIHEATETQNNSATKKTAEIGVVIVITAGALYLVRRRSKGTHDKKDTE